MGPNFFVDLNLIEIRTIKMELARYTKASDTDNSSNLTATAGEIKKQLTVLAALKKKK